MTKPKKPFEITTINGLKVVLYPIKGFPAIKANLWVNAGSSMEQGNQWGAFHFIEHLTFEQTKLFSGRQEIELYKEENGLNNGAATGNDMVFFWTYGPEQSIESALILLNELAFNCTLPHDSLEKQISIIDQEYKGKWDSPYTRFHRSISKQIYGDDHIYIRDGMGDPTYLKSIRQDQLVQLHQDYFTNQNSILSLTGDFDTKNAIDMVKRIFITQGNRHTVPQSPTIPGSKINLHHEDVKQDRICLMWPGPGSMDIDFADRMKIRIASYILGGSTRSQLFQRLRDELHLVYGAGFGRSTRQYSGIIEAWANTSPENTKKAIEEIRIIIYKFIDTPIQKELFDRSVKFLKSNINLAFDSIHSISESITTDLFYDDAIRLPTDVISVIEGINEQAVRDCLSRYVIPDKEFLAIMTQGGSSKP